MGSHDVAVERVAEDAMAPAEAAVDGGGTDAAACTAANCGGACCGDRCIDRTCAGCSLGGLFCPYSTTVPNSNGQCQSSCATCAPDGTGLRVACFSCTSSSSPAGTCAGSGNACPTTSMTGACPCSSADAGTCPGLTQVCASGAGAGNGACLTCGQLGTQGLACKGGPACDQINAACGM